MNNVIFHLAFPVSDIAQTKQFYAEGLGCNVGRETPSSVILNLYGHQLVAHVTRESLHPQKTIYPRHYGIIFQNERDWEVLLERAKTQKLHFRETEKRRFTGSTVEHRTFFLEDPFYNVLEFKYYCHPEAIFGAREFLEVGDPVEA